jgi:hypothetical protein
LAATGSVPQLQQFGPMIVDPLPELVVLLRRYVSAYSFSRNLDGA